jgi:glucan phosphoethanolaminetransferase (alkaline phosphatase superfamily)
LRYFVVAVVSHAHDDAVAQRPRGRRLSTRTLPSGWIAGGVLAIPGVILACLDWSSRRTQIEAWPWATVVTYLGTVALSAALWGALVASASIRRAWGLRVLLVASAAFTVGAQLYFFARYHAYMNPRAVLVGTSMLPSVGQQLWVDRASVLAALMLPAALAATLPLVRERLAPVSRVGSLMSLDLATCALLVAVFGVEPPGHSEQAASPDVLYLASIGSLAKARWQHDESVDRAHPGPRAPLPVSAISALRERRSLLFILTESVRATDTCSVPSPGCSTTPYTNTLLPARFGLSQMRALDSTTAVSLAVLWSGLPPTSSRRALHEAPLLWEYAHAAGFKTAYWTSQNLLFANAGKWLEGLPLSRFVSGTDLDPKATYEVGADDAKLVDVVLGELPSMVGAQAPFVGVVHLSNTHFPYVIDAADAPFQPESHAFGAGDADRVHNRYLDAIHRQDALVARLMRGLRAMPGGDRVAVVFVSDHGEQLRERGAIGHTWGVYDEEVRVPFWIDVPPRALEPAQSDALRALKDEPVTHLDVLPTLLDLAGLWDAPEIATFRRAMPGQSLLRGGTPRRPVVLTNCSSIFTCAFKNWGAMSGTRKLVATENDEHWRCFDVAKDPEERHDLGAAACSDLQTLAEADGRGTPF